MRQTNRTNESPREARMDIATAERWLEGYARAWEEADPDSVASLFGEECAYRAHIFRDAHRGRDGVRAYWRRATDSQSNVRVRTGDLIVSGSTVVAEWWTTMTDTDEGPLTLPGILVLSFDDDGMCRSLREYWADGPGTQDPPDHWGRGRVDGPDHARSFAERWTARYEEAWRALDVDGIPPLFTEDVIYASHPLRDAHRGRDGVRTYTERAYREESDVDVRFAVIAAAGSTAVAEYWALLIEEGVPSTLAGLDLLVFEEDGLCSQLREYWFLEPGRHEPPPEWGT
jgi:ketosteroid isomerase-like protein